MKEKTWLDELREGLDTPSNTVPRIRPVSLLKGLTTDRHFKLPNNPKSVGSIASQKEDTDGSNKT